jgi:hypothetical protein
MLVPPVMMFLLPTIFTPLIIPRILATILGATKLLTMPVSPMGMTCLQETWMTRRQESRVRGTAVKQHVTNGERNCGD